jgi:DNA-binding CsgD family transcriptional regulator
MKRFALPAAAAENEMFEDDEMKALASSSESLTEVATLSRVVGMQALLGSLNAFEMINEPALAITGRGIVVHSNAAATALFDSDFGVRNHRLNIRDGKASQALDCLLQLIDNEDGHSGRRDGTIVARRRTKRPILLNLLPIHGEAHSPFLGAGIILLLTDLDTIHRPPMSVLSEAFSLSPAEANVASRLGTGSSPQEIADQLQVSRETVRNQIKSIFAKTGTHRQAELVALIGRIRG